MAKLSEDLDLVDAMHYATMTVTIHREREMRFRVWLAAKILRLAARILNCNIEFKNG